MDYQITKTFIVLVQLRTQFSQCFNLSSLASSQLLRLLPPPVGVRINEINKPYKQSVQWDRKYSAKYWPEIHEIVESKKEIKVEARSLLSTSTATNTNAEPSRKGRFRSESTGG
ncbi:hypothetical protein BHYA_0072g00100 [Botrytis hyacinthi]|uniref:Uncharacterized protein n=1 Tax=Botrytis hyacinthi TaxID=278943 RepID=A0A4Z1GZ35_9HELO|nr:hypothetical protein BHYA_0072g00100 [Botrytis hyacinthi]